MLKKTKDAAALLAEVIQEAQNHNAEGSTERIEMTNVEISRGLYNWISRSDKFFTAVKEVVGNDAFKFEIIDNGEMGCLLFVKYV